MVICRYSKNHRKLTSALEIRWSLIYPIKGVEAPYYLIGESVESDDKIVYDKRVLVSIPTRGEIRAECVGWLVDALRNCVLEGHQAGMQVIVSPYPIDHMRNHQIRGFLETDYNYLFLLDSDCEPPRDCITKLLEYDKDIVGSVCPGIVEGKVVYTAAMIDEAAIKAGGPHKYMMHGPKSEDLPKGLVEVDAMGATGVLIKREVIEKMKYPWFKVLYTPDGEDIRSGEDFFFCAKAKELGYKIWADFDLIQKHYKVVSI